MLMIGHFLFLFSQCIPFQGSLPGKQQFREGMQSATGLRQAWKAVGVGGIHGVLAEGMQNHGYKTGSEVICWL